MTSHRSADLANSSLAYDSRVLDTEEPQPPRPEQTADVSRKADTRLITSPPSQGVAILSGRTEWKADPAKPCRLMALPNELLELIARAAVQLPPFRRRVSRQLVRRLPIMQLSQTCRCLHEHCKRVFFEEQEFDLHITRSQPEYTSYLTQTPLELKSRFAIPTYVREFTRTNFVYPPPSVREFTRKDFVYLPIDRNAPIHKLRIAEGSTKKGLIDTWRRLVWGGLRMADCHSLTSTKPQEGAPGSEIWSDRRRKFPIKLTFSFQSVTSLIIELDVLEQFGWLDSLQYLCWKRDCQERRVVSIPDADDIRTACILLLDMFPAVKMVHVHRKPLAQQPQLSPKWVNIVAGDEATPIVESVLQHPGDEDLDPEVLKLATTARAEIGDKNLAIMDHVYRVEKWLVERDSKLADTFAELIALKRSTPESFNARLRSLEIPREYDRVSMVTEDVKGTQIKFMKCIKVRR